MFKGFLTIVLIVLSFGVQAGDKPFGERSLMSDSSIADRVERTGAVCLEGEACAGQVAKPMEQEVVEVASGPRTGDAIYTSYCAGCHVSGAAGAPKVGDAAVWSARVDARGGEEELWASAWKGIGAMPPKGMCMDCSEDEFAGAVAFMLKESQ